MLKVGMIGAGFVAHFHSRALESVRGAELSAVYALKGAEELAQFAQNLGIGRPKICKTVAELVQNCDVVANFAPNYVRIELMAAVAEAVKAGARLKGLICEKPLARNMAEANEVIKLARGLGCPNAYFENQIHMPTLTEARRQLAGVEKSMGAMHLARSAEEHGGPHEPWFWDPTRQGGGVCCDMGCHSLAAGMFMVTPAGKAPDYLTPMSINANMALLKWGKEPWISQLRKRGVDYSKTPAEDYSHVTIALKDPRTGVISRVEAANSWMYDAPGLRLLMEAFGPGYSATANSLQSPAGIFISDSAAAAVADSELALEKSQASRGALVIVPHEADLYGYCAEWRDALGAFEVGKDAMLNLEYGRLITKLTMAAYMSHEKRKAIDLTDPAVNKELETYIPLIQQGKGGQVL